MNEITTVHFAVEALQAQCLRGETTLAEAREYLAAFGGTRTPQKGVEVWLFEGQPWDVEVMTSERDPDNCILWRVQRRSANK